MKKDGEICPCIDYRGLNTLLNTGNHFHLSPQHWNNFVRHKFTQFDSSVSEKGMSGKLHLSPLGVPYCLANAPAVFVSLVILTISLHIYRAKIRTLSMSRQSSYLSNSINCMWKIRNVSFTPPRLYLSAITSATKELRWTTCQKSRQCLLSGPSLTQSRSSNNSWALTIYTTGLSEITVSLQPLSHLTSMVNPPNCHGLMLPKNLWVP